MGITAVAVETRQLARVRVNARSDRRGRGGVAAGAVYGRRIVGVRECLIADVTIGATDDAVDAGVERGALIVAGQAQLVTGGRRGGARRRQKCEDYSMELHG